MVDSALTLSGFGTSHSFQVKYFIKGGIELPLNTVYSMSKVNLSKITQEINLPVIYFTIRSPQKVSIIQFLPFYSLLTMLKVDETLYSVL